MRQRYARESGGQVECPYRVAGKASALGAGSDTPQSAYYPEGESCPDLGWVLVLNDPPAGSGPDKGKVEELMSDLHPSSMGSGQGLTLVHFSAQLEPCLTQENILHRLNTP